jgi:hypothetical protein
MQVGNLLYDALRLAGVMPRPGMGYSNTDSTEALGIANAFIDYLATQRLLVFQIGQYEFNVVANQQDYTIGPGAPDFPVPHRPVRIEFASLIQVSSPDTSLPTYLPLSILNAQDWASIAVPAITSSTPQKLYYKPDWPLGLCRLWPVPQISNQIALWLWEVIEQMVNLTDTISFPPGYYRMLKYNLAVEFASLAWHDATQHPLNPMVIDQARESMVWLKSMNAMTLDLQMHCEKAVLGNGAKGRWDITTNQWRWQ